MSHLARRSSLVLSAILLGLAGLALVMLVVRPPHSDAGGTPDTLPAAAPVVLFPAADAFVVVELARTDAERQRGLMERASLEEGAGMLFIFPTSVRAPFWMRNTYIPLSIAFIDEQRNIIDIQDMQPLDETLHYPPAPYRYALEVPQGWFQRAGVTVGQRVEVPVHLLDDDEEEAGAVCTLVVPHRLG